MLTAPGPATPLHGALVILPTTGGQVACPAQRFWLSDKGGWQLPDSTAPTAWEVFQPHSVPTAQDCDRVAWDIGLCHTFTTQAVCGLCSVHHTTLSCAPSAMVVGDLDQNAFSLVHPIIQHQKNTTVSSTDL